MADAPEIDGVVRIANAESLKPGQFAEVRVTGAGAHDLEASCLHPPDAAHRSPSSGRG